MCCRLGGGALVKKNGKGSVGHDYSFDDGCRGNVNLR